jgi:hypothetical protein
MEMINRCLTLFAAFWVVLLATACAPQSELLYKDRKLLSGENGLLVGSLGYRTSTGQAVAPSLKTPWIGVFVKSISNPSMKELYFGNTVAAGAKGGWRDAEAVVRTDEGGRVLIGYKLPPGEYEASGYGVDLLGGPVSWSARPRLRVPMRFSVTAGAITYIGFHEVDLSGAASFLDMSAPGRASVHAWEKFDDDTALLYVIRPDLSGAPIQDAAKIFPRSPR